MITGLEVGVYYLQATSPTACIAILLLVMAFVKFFLVAFFMHLRTDRPIFRRFFILGSSRRVVLYTIVLTTLHVFE